MRAGKDQASLHIQAVSPEPSLIALKRRHVDEGSGIIVYTISRDFVSAIIVYTISCDLGTYCICEQGKTRRVCTFAQSCLSVR